MDIERLRRLAAMGDEDAKEELARMERRGGERPIASTPIAEQLLQSFPELTITDAESLGNRIERSSYLNVDDILRSLSDLISAFGIETIDEQDHWDRYWGSTIAVYVNTGETYSATLLYDTREREFHVTSYGDWVESRERESKRTTQI